MGQVTDSVRAAGNLAFERIRSAGKEARGRGESVDGDFAYRRFALERLLQSLNESRFAGRCCLRGGMLLLSIGSFRTTEDLDLTRSRLPEAADMDVDDLATVKSIFAEIGAARPVEEDGLTYSVDDKSWRLLYEDGPAPCARIILKATLHTRSGDNDIPVKLDIGSGVVVRPGLRSVRLPPSCKGYEPPEIPSYPWEQVVAEKLAAMIDKGMASTRLRDLYDLCVVSKSVEFDLSILSQTVRECLIERGHGLETELAMLTQAFAKLRQREWSLMVSRPGYTAGIKTLVEAQDEVRRFTPPILLAAKGEAVASASMWHPARGWGSAEPSAVLDPLSASP